jgi:Phosphoserine phosphatase RsbU, N-terminal domain
MTVSESLQRDYRAAFLRYLPRRDEVALHAGYELGRAAVHNKVSILDLAQVHHDILVEVIRTCPPAEVVEVATGGSEFFLEVLATYDMAQRSFLDTR